MSELQTSTEAEFSLQTPAPEPSSVPDPPKRKRGRPRKSELLARESAAATNPETSGNQPLEKIDQPPRKRGRPRKVTTTMPKEPDSSLMDMVETLPAQTAVPKRSAKRAKSSAEKTPDEESVVPANKVSNEDHTGSSELPNHTMEEVSQRTHPQVFEGAPQQTLSQDDALETGRPRRTHDQQPIKTSKYSPNTRHRNKRSSDIPSAPTLTRETLSAMKIAELRTKATELGIDSAGIKKAALVEEIYQQAAILEGFRTVEGVLEITSEGYGCLRTGNYMEGDHDCFVHQQLIRVLGLRPGDFIQATTGPSRSNSKYPPVQRIVSVNGRPPENLKQRPRFKDLTPIFPNERLVMESGKDSITGRAIDLVSPIGKGQRGLIVSPPKAGKTTVLKKICTSITTNNPEVKLFCLLVDERPEEVTDMQRSIKGTVVASTFDMPAENHTRVSELVIEHAKRLVELGEDVVVVLDSITRLARAYNLAQPASGRVLSGGVDSAALYPPKKFLGAARNIEGGGSLTIIASALVDTGSKMDEVIFEEFKGTGNMELKLDRELADKRIFPAIDPVTSGTRNEDLLIDPEYQVFVWGVRRLLANMNSVERAANALVKGLKGTDSNQEFLIRSAKKAQMFEERNSTQS